MSLSLSGRPQCERYKVAGPIQATKEDKAELSAVPWTHNQNRNEAKGKGHTERNMLNRPTYSEWICYRN